MRVQSARIWMGLMTLVLAGCSSASSGEPTPQVPQPVPSQSAPSSGSSYHPTIDPSRFSPVISNRYFPLRPGRTLVYDGIWDGKPQHTEMKVAGETRVIMGVKCVVVRDDVTSNGALVEKTTDW